MGETDTRSQRNGEKGGKAAWPCTGLSPGGRNRTKTQEFNLHTFILFSFHHPSPLALSIFLPPHRSPAGSKFGLEIREFKQDPLCLSARL